MNFLKKLLRPFFSEKLILWTHKVRGQLAAFLYSYPGKKLYCIGVTGTNGKTTVCNLIGQLLASDGQKVAMATTINFQINDKVWENNSKMTTMSPFRLQKFLAQAVKAKCKYAVVETTSHALVQNRVFGIDYKVRVFTNLTHDHLDYHKTMEKYREAKSLLFRNRPDLIVANLDDKAGEYYAQFPSRKTITYALKNKADLVARKVLLEPKGSLFTAVDSVGQIPVDFALPGEFNILNALASIAVAKYLGIKDETIKKTLESIQGIPGRLERLDEGQNFHVIVDFAHTPDALQQTYKTLESTSRGKIIAVFGATGRRDKTKRPIMGALAGRYADIAIVTNEDPYTEDPQAIIDEVAKGVVRGATKEKPKRMGKTFFKILDRGEAIEKAIGLAGKDDIVIITGKGAEKIMAVREKKIPWDDRDVARRLIRKKLRAPV